MVAIIHIFFLSLSFILIISSFIMSIKNYIEENKERFPDEWFRLIRIPSVSSQQEHKPDMQACAECWRDILFSSGADRAEVMPTEGNPAVYAGRSLMMKY